MESCPSSTITEGSTTKDQVLTIPKDVSETDAINMLKSASDNSLVETLQYNGGLAVALVVKLCGAITQSKSITTLEIKSTSCGTLLKFLPSFNPSESDFSVDHVQNLFVALSVNKTIKNLRLIFSKTYNSLVLGLIYLFRNNTTIENFIFQAVEIPSNSSLLIESLASNSSLKNIDIPITANNDIVPALKNTLETNKTLQSVTLHMNHASKDFIEGLQQIDNRIVVIFKEGKESSSSKKKKNKKKKKKKNTKEIPTTSSSSGVPLSESQGSLGSAAPAETKTISFQHKQKLRDIIYDIISSGEQNSLNSSDLKNVLSEFGEFSVDVNKSNKWTVTLKPSVYLEGFRLHREQLCALYQYLISLVKSNKENAYSNFTAWVHQQNSVSLSISHFLELFPHTFARTDNFLKLLPFSAFSNIEQDIAQLTPNTPLHHNSQLFRNLIVLTSHNKKIKENIVEKDYYVTYVLSRFAQTGFKFVLKGGTSLSKSWKLLPRVCEDVDLLVVGTESWASDSVLYSYHQLRKIRSLNYVNGNDEHKEYRRSIMQLMGDQICKKLVEVDAKTFKKVEIMFDRSCQQLQLTVFYDPLFGPSGEEESLLLFPWIRVEISLDHVPDYYWLNSTLKSFVGDYIDESLHLNPLVWFLNVYPVSVSFLSLDPRLTLLQKLFDCIILRYRRDISKEEDIPYYSTPWVVPKSSEPQFDPRIVRHYEDAAFVLQRLSSVEAKQDVELFDVINKLDQMKWIDFFSNIKRQRLLRRNQFLLADELLHTELCFQLQDAEKLGLMENCQRKRSCLYYTGVSPPSLTECTAVITDWFRRNFV